MRTRYGQNFLMSSKWQHKIVSYFKPPDGFAEIGPGKGAITRILKEKFSSFDLFEIDANFEKLHTDETKRVRFHRMDFLDWNFQLNGQPVENFSLIGNLPYESASAMMIRVAENATKISHFVFLIQREVAERVTAQPKNREFGSLSVLMQTHFDVRAGSVVPPGAFQPAPKVDSQIIVGNRREDSAFADAGFNRFVQAAFMFKRKRLRFALKKQFSEERIGVLYQKLYLSENTRAEEISVDEWPKVYKVLNDG